MGSSSWRYRMTDNLSSKYLPESDTGISYDFLLSSLMRDYFSSLGDSAHPNSSDPRARAITKFQELLLVSFREFAVITEETIFSERRRFRNEIISSIESFSK